MISRICLILFLFFGILLASSRGISQNIIEGDQQQQEAVTITYLQNDGVLISNGTKKILIDAIFGMAASWINLDQTENSKLTNAQEPYDNVDLILISHNHSDHYWLSNINTHLTNNTNGKVIAPPQVMANFSGPQFINVTPSLGESDTLTVNGVEIEVLHLKHFDAFGFIFSDVENFGYVINIGGSKILHLGDIEMTVENLQNFGLAENGIDVVLIPTFYTPAHLMSTHRDALLSQVDPDHIIALHLLAGSIPSIVQQVNDLYPGATIFTTPLETYTLDVTAVEHEDQIPKVFELSQNFPNPFNPVTKINYSVPQSTSALHVTIKVFDLLGNHVTTLVDGIKSVGNFTVDFSGEGLSSGTYIYTLQAGNKIIANKMVFMK